MATLLYFMTAGSLLSVVIKGQQPTQCETDGSVLNCRRRGLTAIPDLRNISTAIRTVDLSLNEITSISVIEADERNGITNLRLDHNRINKINDMAFQRLEALTALDISYNKLEGGQITTNTFSGIANLLYLNISTNPIKHLQTLGSTLRSLQDLHLSGCQLGGIEPAALKRLGSLIVLDLGDNKLMDITEWASQDFGSLVNVDLSRNLMTDLGASSFSSSPKLQYLNLSHNVIDKFPNLDKISAIQIDLTFNKLKSLEVDGVQMTNSSLHHGNNDQNTGLKNLYLSYNLLQSIGVNLSPKLASLEVLDLSHNRLNALAPDSFSKLQNLLEITLAFNNISSLDGVVIPPTLGALDLSGNNLQDVPHSALMRLDYLYFLLLDGNPIKTIHAIPRPIEGDFIYARWVYIRNMPLLETITDLGFQSFVAMENLYLSENPNLREIGQNPFARSISSLETVVMRNNSITSISENMLQWANMEKADFGNNPFRCDKRLCWILEKRDEIQQLLGNIR